ncbi:MAG: superoxide dismutase, Cu-Zn family [Mycobacterium sp.]|jgi:Cu-Zn family superoxide dismutase|nr:superoxide dismutase, Cu-Zn family [Mycobacterium sp.]
MVKPAAVAAVLLAVPALALTACSPNQNPSTVTGTTPSVWTGSPAPGASSTSASTTASSAAEGSSRKLTAKLATPDGRQAATATFEFSGDFATVTVETTGGDVLAPGFHALHIHSVGKCEANSVAPTGGAPGDFLSAGGHFQVPGKPMPPHSGDLSSLQVRGDHTARLVTTTDSVTADELLAGAGTAIIIHEKSDNFANIPPRYTQGDGTTGPDAESLATGDAGKRVACGVITG